MKTQGKVLTLLSKSQLDFCRQLDLFVWPTEGVPMAVRGLKTAWNAGVAVEDVEDRVELAGVAADLGHDVDGWAQSRFHVIGQRGKVYLHCKWDTVKLETLYFLRCK